MVLQIRVNTLIPSTFYILTKNPSSSLGFFTDKYFWCFAPILCAHNEYPFLKILPLCTKVKLKIRVSGFVSQNLSICIKDRTLKYKKQTKKEATIMTLTLWIRGLKNTKNITNPILKHAIVQKPTMCTTTATNVGR